MSRTTFRFATWRIFPAKAPKQPVTFQMECAKCAVLLGPYNSRTRSPLAETLPDVQDWALRHSGRNPDHTLYREIVRRLWETELVE